MSWRDVLRPGIEQLPPARGLDADELGDPPALVRHDLNEGALAPSVIEMSMLKRELEKLELNRYPDATGRALRERLAERFGVAPDEILLGNGSVETIGILMTAFGGMRDGSLATVIHPEPTYGQYDLMASSYGLRALAIPLGPRFELEEARVAEVIDRERPSLAFFANPNSPTGNLFDPRALVRLAQRMDAVFVVDEAYADFSGTSLLAEVRTTPGLFVMRSLSKIGLAGLRVGALIGERAAIAELDKVRLPFNVNAVSLALATCLLEHPAGLDQRIAAIVRLRRELESALAGIHGVEVFPSCANFVLIRTQYESARVFHALLARGVLVRMFPHAPQLERCLRITAGTALENQRCLRALREGLAELAGARPSAAEAVA